MSILFITHDMGSSPKSPARIVVIYDGQVLETECTERIFAAPSHSYTRALLSAVPRLGSMEGGGRRGDFRLSKETGTSDEPIETPDKVATAQRPVLELPI